MAWGSTKYPWPGTYCTALAVVERATMCCAVQPFRLTSRSVLLHEDLASLNGDSGKTSVEWLGFCWRGSTREAVDKVVLQAEVLYW